MNKPKTRKLYKTTSLPVACALSLLYPLIDIDKSNPTKASFVFEESENLLQSLNDYWTGSLKIDPQTYFNQLKTIKGRLYSNE